MSHVVRILAALVMLAAALPAFAQEGARTIETTNDADYFGFDLRTVQNIGIEDCKAICLGDRQCKAFTYNVKAKWCFLKSDYSEMNPFPGAIAGRVVSGSSEPEIGAAPELTFIPSSSLSDARTYRENLIARASGGSAGGAEALVGAGRAASAAGDHAGAMRSFAGAAAIDSGNSAIWLALSRAALDLKTDDQNTARGARSVAVSAAINAYQTSRTRTARAEALSALGSAYERIENWRPALESWKASLELVESPALRAAYVDLRSRKGFRVIDNTVDADATSPRACVQFSESLQPGTDFSGFVSVADAPNAPIETEDRQICIDGLEHGKRYQVTFREGLPSAVGEVLEAPIQLTIYVRDRAPAARFTGNNFVLPSHGRHGIPLVTINAPKANLTLYRVGERALTDVLKAGNFLTQLDSWSADNISENSGQLVWKGEIEIMPDPNKEVVTSVPIDEILPERRPGVYILSAVPEGDKSESWEPRATQWFVISDIGLSTFAGADGLSVFLRSLESAKPLEGVDLTLIATNNEILGEATTDADGRAVFTAGLIRGTGGLAPMALAAKGEDDDFVFIDMTRGGFDLSDRGVTGRRAPGAIDVLAWTERGIYRPGETVHLSALVRDDTAKALDDLPITVILQRPDGVEDRRVVSTGAELGGHAIEFPIPTNAMTGTWLARIFTDPEREALAEKSFLIEDFQPDRIEFDLAAPDAPISVDAPGVVEIEGRYLYGAPAAGLYATGEVVISRTRTHKDHPGFLFGLADEEMEAARIEIEASEPLDEDGRGFIDVSVDEAPSTSQYATADVTVRLAEEGGRAVERKITLDIAADGPRIGIAPEFEGGEVSENSNPGFRLIAVDADGKRMDMPGVSWSLIKIERNYQWYRSGSSWNYEAVDFSTEIADGTVDLTASGPVRIEAPVTWGRYRLEVTGDDAQSSVLFDAGWYVATTSTETPDGLEIALDKERYEVGDTARLHVSPRFAGEVLVTVGTDRIVEVATASIGEGGGTIDLPVTADWGPGAYVTATLYRPAGASENRMPMRAIGVKWLTVAPGERKLDVAIDLPDQGEPRAPLRVPVTLAGFTPGTEAYVSVAAVDVGILNLTNHKGADPEAWYFGQRALGLEIRDIYGRLIDGSAGVAGRIRTGGDGAYMRAEGSPPKEKLVAFFEGPVKVDDDGKVEITFDMPQFNGTVRVSAVAWSGTAVGHAEKDIIIRDPVVITASMPQFLAPGDESRLLLEFANTDGPAGSYTLSVSSGFGRVEAGEGDKTIELGQGARTSLSLPLTGLASGDDALTIALSGPGGLSISREEVITVRPAAMPLATRRTLTLAANGGSVRVDRELLEGNMLEGASVSIGVMRNAAFDVGALLMALDRYPYGCAEQTTSRALPLLYLSELDRSLGEDAEIRKRIQDAIVRIVSFQAASGSFGLWGPGSGDLWLDAYITDFLTRAEEKGFTVPPESRRLAVDNLQNTLAYTTDLSTDGSGIAYALYVLARNRKASVSDLRYYSDSRIQAFSAPLARAQIAAALSLYGEQARAEESFRSAFTHVKSSASLISGRADYGSSLRDGAGILALAAESTPAPTSVMPELIGFVENQFSARRSTSTQENAWMVLASRALVEANRSLSIDVNGTAHEGGFSQTLSGDELLANPITVVNRSSTPVDAVITTYAAPIEPLPAGGDGFTIDRAYYTLEGEQVSIQEVTQNDRFVVVLSMTEANTWPARVVVTDLLPAGFQIDNPRLVGSADVAGMGWLPEPSAAHSEFRKDRFVVAFDRTGGASRTFTAAYVVRAVTPGVYTVPAAVVEDMYRPELSARTATGVMEVKAAR